MAVGLGFRAGEGQARLGFPQLGAKEHIHNPSQQEACDWYVPHVHTVSVSRLHLHFVNGAKVAA